jgi:predicted DNA-binding protein (MmcQ/YjbR family)
MNRSKGPNAIPGAREVLESLRALCLSLPETSERASWGHPNFLVGKKTFVTFEIVHGRPSIAFRLNPGDVQELTRKRQFFSSPYGRGQWISMWVDVPFEWAFVRNLIARSYRLVALKSMLPGQESIARKR